MSDYDVIVIGGGAPGEHCAGALAEGGLRVAVVERELVGGECSYWACIPSKTLLRPGEAARAANDAAAPAQVAVEAALAWRADHPAHRILVCPPGCPTGANRLQRRHTHSHSPSDLCDRVQRRLTMSIDSTALIPEASPTYLASGDPSLADYYPTWLDNLADDVTVEGSMLDGAVQGAEAARAVVVTIRTLYGESQEFHSAGPWGDNSWVEDYIAQVDGKPIGCVVLVTRNAAGQTQHIVASYRPRSSVILFARLLGEKFAGTPIAAHFVTSHA